MKKIYALSAVCLCACLLFASCGNAAVSGSSSDTVSAPEASSKTEVSSTDDESSEAVSEPETSKSAATQKTESGVIVYNVKDYGAKANGADDSAAIQKAINACAANGGGTVYLPAGSYSIASTILKKASVSIKGDGMWTSRLTWTGKADSVMIDTANESLWGTSIESLFLSTSVSGITGIRGGSTLKNYNSAIGTFKDLVLFKLACGIDGGAEPEGVGIFDCMFENIFCSDCEYGLHLYGSGNTVIHPRVATCKAGIVLDWLNGESFDGIHVIGGIFAANTVDILVPNKNGTRPCDFVGTWFETASQGIISVPNAGTRVMNMTFRDCMLNSSADGTNFHLFDVSNVSGVVTLDSCTVVDDKGFIGPTLSSAKLEITNLQVYQGNGSTYIINDTDSGLLSSKGDGKKTAFKIAHDIGAEPSYASVTPASEAAAAGKYYITVDKDYLTVTFTSAPAAGDEVKFYWETRK